MEVKVNRSIHTILAEFIELVDMLEDNGGELTEETEELLIQNKEDFEKKVDSYCHIIREKESQNQLLKDEIERLQARAKTNQRSVEKLKDILLNAVLVYGHTNKTGTKGFETLVNKLSTRKSDSVVINDEEILIEKLKETINVMANACVEEINEFTDDVEHGRLNIGYKITEGITDVEFEELPTSPGVGLFSSTDAFENEGNVPEPIEAPKPVEPVESPLNFVEVDFLQNHLTYDAKLSIRYTDMVKVAHYLSSMGYPTSSLDFSIKIPKKEASAVVKSGNGFRIARIQTKQSLTMK